MERSLFFQTPEEILTELKARVHPRDGDKHELRSTYFRDATAIIHSYPFRRLKHKTQVFSSPKNDHICTRIEHVMHVASISATVCRVLGLDSDLVWAIGLGHDLGHAPFGHAGEYILTDLIGKTFSHEQYGLRVVDYLANKGRGLNLTYAVRDGIISHCGEKFEQTIEPSFVIKDLADLKPRSTYPTTWEGCVVRVSDKIAYLGRDTEDAMSLGIIKKSDIPASVVDLLGNNNADIINNLVTDLIETSMASGKIGFSSAIYEQFLVLKTFNYEAIYNSDYIAQWQSYYVRILTFLFNYLSEIYTKYKIDFSAYAKEQNSIALEFSHYLEALEPFYVEVDRSFDQAPFDYLAGMTDDFASSAAKEIFFPEHLEGHKKFTK